eukprot:gene7836-671_t
MSLLSGTSKQRNYGTTITRRTDMCIQHTVLDTDTLQHIAVKYDVSVDDILHLNRLFPTDSIHLRKILLVPSRHSIKRKSNINETETQDVRTIPPCQTTTQQSSIKADDFLKQFDERFARAKFELESSIKKAEFPSPMTKSAQYTPPRPPDEIFKQGNIANSASTETPSRGNKKNKQRFKKKKKSTVKSSKVAASHSDDLMTGDVHLFEL